MGLGWSLGFYGFLSPPGDSDVQTNLKTADLDFVCQARMTWPRVAITTGMGTFFFIHIQFFPQQVFLLIMCHTMLGLRSNSLRNVALLQIRWSKIRNVNVRFSELRRGGGA